MKSSRIFTAIALITGVALAPLAQAMPVYSNVTYGGRVIVNNQSCTLVITSYYSSSTYSSLSFLYSTTGYTACEPLRSTNPVGAPGTIGTP